ncbi:MULTISPECIES: hypothetical protein [Nocardioides]|uniref:Phosphatase PAP2 family protein n=1 Tax=Nocardioides vastitatis TaxID=2568655 RepID=A0ABW0ZID1_9ACTN|nr:hypothetical protein [Nocardioides sp.]THJ11212.1 hypothetical protein E7Z54_02470 [Nocardioides sp.]
MRQRAGAVALTAACVLLFAVLCLLVLTRTTDRLDLWVGARIDPDPEWNPLQEKADHAVHAFGPVRQVAVVTALALVLSAWRRRLGPLILTLGVVGAASVVEIGVKWVLPRLESHDPIHHAGSFPSGHLTLTLSCAGALVLASGAASHWWAWTVVVALGAAMAAGLLITDTHRLTDLAGGALIATGTLALARVAARLFDRQYGGEGPDPAAVATPNPKNQKRRTPSSIA